MTETTVHFRALADQSGMALISALLLLLVISLMAVGVSMDTSMDVRIAGYQRFKARSFGFSESGLMTATDILEDNIHDAGWATAVPFPYPGLSDDYNDNGSIQILDSGSFYMNKNSDENTVMEMTGDIQAEIVVQRLVTRQARGGAIQMAAGYAGLGKGAGGAGAQLIYNVTATGSDSDQSRTDLALYYRHVTN